MPIYEFQSVDLAAACGACAGVFEIIRPAGTTLAACPHCGGSVQRVVSRCLAVIAAQDGVSSRVERTITDYERQGKWSHAAELAEKQSVKTADNALRERAFDNYKKAGYQEGAIDRHAGKTAS